MQTACRRRSSGARAIRGDHPKVVPSPLQGRGQHRWPIDAIDCWVRGAVCAACGVAELRPNECRRKHLTPHPFDAWCVTLTLVWCCLKQGAKPGDARPVRSRPPSPPSTEIPARAGGYLGPSFRWDDSRWVGMGRWLRQPREEAAPSHPISTSVWCASSGLPPKGKRSHFRRESYLETNAVAERDDSGVAAIDSGPLKLNIISH